ncbi:hypothetical protein [Saprospira grandis]|uniref:hypothetical protein n=1 Tax=Saprospira grandis TaxID=1008 RepID=UPI0022DD556C|nr:hypothetical protein [Saprospira grandis]WBM75477.1 hypothetical protein OP864_04360 [Saprospira grandis]
MSRLLFLPLLLFFFYQPAEAQLMNRLKNKAKAGVAGVKAQPKAPEDVKKLSVEERRALYAKNENYQVVVGNLRFPAKDGRAESEVAGAAFAAKMPNANSIDLAAPLEQEDLIKFVSFPETKDWVGAGEQFYSIVEMSCFIYDQEAQKSYNPGQYQKAGRMLQMADGSWIVYVVQMQSAREFGPVEMVAAGAKTEAKAQELFKAQSSIDKAEAVEAKIRAYMAAEEAKQLEARRQAAAKVQVPKKGAMDKNSDLRALSKKYLTELCEKDGTPLLYFHLESNDWTPYMNQLTSKPFYRWCKGAFVQKNKDGSCMLHGFTLKQRYVGGKYHTEIEFGGVIQGQVPYGSYISCDNIPK